MNRNEFFKKLYQFCEGKVEIRPLPGKPKFYDFDDHAGIESHCRKYESNNLFFGVASRDGNGGKKENLVNIPAVWCDCDFKDTPRDIIAEKLKNFPFKPSIIVKSGGGVHLYWLLKEPADKTDVSTIETINRRIAGLLGVDHNSCDAARVLRIPDTLNHKYDPPRTCEATQYNDFYYDPNDFLEILPESTHDTFKQDPETEKDPNWLIEVMKGVDTNVTSRNATGTRIAGYFINKLLTADVLTILKTWNLNNTPPLDEKELQTIVKSVSRYKPELETKHRVDIFNVYNSERMIQEYRQYIKNLKNNRFITGIHEIDKRIRGVAGGEVLTIIARSGSFKTAMLQNLIKNYVQNSAWGAVFFSIEMPVAGLAERYLCILDGSTGKEVEELFSDNSQDIIIQDAAAQEFIKDLKNLFIVPTKVSLSDIPAYVQLIEKELDVKIGVIGIDYLGLMEGIGSTEYETISRLAVGLKSTAKLLNIPVIVLSQVSRKGGDGKVEISLDMGRGSGAIEEGTDFLLGLWQVSEGDGKALICRILKNRKGPIGSRWKLDLIPSTLQIGPKAEQYSKDEGNSGIRI